MIDFYKEVSLLLAKSIDNFYPDNFDWELRRSALSRRVILWVEVLPNSLMQLFGKIFLLLINAKCKYYLQKTTLFEQTFSLLEDDDSRKRYIELLGCRILGFTKVKL